MILRWIRERPSRKLALALLPPLALTLAVSDGLLIRDLQERFILELVASLKTQARLIAARLPASAFASGGRELHALAHPLGQACGCRVTFIALDGRVVGDSELTLQELGRERNHASRPEVKGALEGREDWDVRRSPTLGADLLYAAVPWPRVGPPQGAVRVAVLLTRIRGKAAQLRWLVLGANLSVCLLSVALALGLWRLTRPR